MSDLIVYEPMGQVAVIRLNRPEQLNCINTPMFQALASVFQKLDADTAVRAAVLTGAGRAFCAGGDIAVINGCTSETEANTNILAANQAVTALYTCAKPVIAAVNGAAAGAGFALALGCDMIFASEKASFMMAFAKVGLAGDCGAHWLLQRAVGPYLAKELLLSCRSVSAQEGRAMGFVNRICPPETLEQEAVAFAQTLAAGAPLALMAIKDLLNQSATKDFVQMLQEEQTHQVPLLLSQDCKEGTAAFFEKRPAVFQGK